MWGVQTGGGTKAGLRKGSCDISTQRYDADGNKVLDHLKWGGTAGNDIIRGSALNDWITGNAGAETFEFAQLPGLRPDVVKDFTTWVDHLALNSDVFDLHGQNIADVLASVSGSQTEASGAYL